MQRTRLLTDKLNHLFNTNKQFMSMDSYVWIDLEMTGLDPVKDKILEVACIITSPSLNPVHDGINLVIHQPDEVLESMNEWCIKNHNQTGLTQASRNSKLSLSNADIQVANYVKKYTNPVGNNYIAGNSVYMDKIFLCNHMPILSSLLHYRIIDISTIKVLCSHLYPEEYKQLPKKKLVHRALDDIQESIEELKEYRSAFFNYKDIIRTLSIIFNLLENFSEDYKKQYIPLNLTGGLYGYISIKC